MSLIIQIPHINVNQKIMNFTKLKKGDVIDIISPGTACDLEEISQIKKLVKKIGFLPRIFLEKELTLKKSVKHEFPSFDAAKRFAQLKNAIENSESKIIWCARGGYGSADLITFLKSLKKPKNPKIFIGFSDISSINLFLIQEWGWEVITAPMLIQLALKKVSIKSQKAILDLLLGKTKELKYELTALNTERKNLSKIVVGGCISVIAAHFATKNQINWEDKILFLEDEGEDGERLDRYFQQILTIIIESKKLPAAILLGNFLEANPHGTPKAKNIEMAIKRFVEKIAKNKLEIAIFQEKLGNLGHSKNMMPLILGKKAEINNGVLIQK